MAAEGEGGEAEGDEEEEEDGEGQGQRRWGETPYVRLLQELCDAVLEDGGVDELLLRGIVNGDDGGEADSQEEGDPRVQCRAVARAFLRLGEEARALFARLFTRKGPWFRVDKLRGRYPELPSAATLDGIHALVKQLVDAGMLCAAAEDMSTDALLDAVGGCLSSEELRSVTRMLVPSRRGGPSSAAAAAAAAATATVSTSANNASAPAPRLNRKADLLSTLRERLGTQRTLFGARLPVLQTAHRAMLKSADTDSNTRATWLVQIQPQALFFFRRCLRVQHVASSTSGTSSGDVVTSLLEPPDSNAMLMNMIGRARQADYSLGADLPLFPTWNDFVRWEAALEIRRAMVEICQYAIPANLRGAHLRTDDRDDNDSDLDPDDDSSDDSDDVNATSPPKAVAVRAYSYRRHCVAISSPFLDSWLPRAQEAIGFREKQTHAQQQQQHRSRSPLRNRSHLVLLAEYIEHARALLQGGRRKGRPPEAQDSDANDEKNTIAEVVEIPDDDEDDEEEEEEEDVVVEEEGPVMVHNGYVMAAAQCCNLVPWLIRCAQQFERRSVLDAPPLYACDAEREDQWSVQTASGMSDVPVRPVARGVAELAACALALAEQWTEIAAGSPRPLFWTQLEACTVLASTVWDGVAVLDAMREYRTAVRLLRALLASRATPHRRGRWYSRLALDLERHCNDPHGALVAVREGLADPMVSGGDRIDLEKRASRLQKAMDQKTTEPTPRVPVSRSNSENGRKRKSQTAADVVVVSSDESDEYEDENAFELPERRKARQRCVAKPSTKHARTQLPSSSSSSATLTTSSTSSMSSLAKATTTFTQADADARKQQWMERASASIDCGVSALARTPPWEWDGPHQSFLTGRRLNRTTGSKSRFVGYLDGGEVVGVEELVLQHFAVGISVDAAANSYCPLHMENGEVADTRREDFPDNIGGGWCGWHCEGGPLRSLFALLMWNELFQDVPNCFVSRFQDAPLDLDWPGLFYEHRRVQIDKRLQEIAGWSALQLVRALGARWRRCFNMRCRGVTWRRSLRTLQAIAVCMGSRALAGMCRVFCVDAKTMGGGMPDLLLLRVLWRPTAATEAAEAAAADTWQVLDMKQWLSWAGEPPSPNTPGSTGSGGGGDGTDTAFGSSAFAPPLMYDTPRAAWVEDEVPPYEERFAHPPDLVVPPVLLGTRGSGDSLVFRYEAMLVEVKGPSDRLADRQRMWLQLFAESGVAACVCRVREGDAKRGEAVGAHL